MVGDERQGSGLLARAQGSTLGNYENPQMQISLHPQRIVLIEVVWADRTLSEPTAVSALEQVISNWIRFSQKSFCRLKTHVFELLPGAPTSSYFQVTQCDVGAMCLPSKTCKSFTTHVQTSCL